MKPEIQERVSELKCLYKDILWESDFSVKFGPVTIVEGSNAYILKASDFVEVNCIAIDRSDGISKK